MNASPLHINTYLQAELVRRGKTAVTAVEAAKWLDEAGLLRDQPNRPGLPLRKMLRDGLISNSRQVPPQKNGNWFVVRAE